MKLAKTILMHNINNFCHSVSMHVFFFKKGMESKLELMIGILSCLRERTKLYHWKPSSFI